MNPSNRFVVSNITGTYGRTVILGDWQYWAEHEEELRQWCRQHAAVRQGMTVDMDEETLLLFVMRWS